jgi:cation:H+ antiporter
VNPLLSLLLVAVGILVLGYGGDLLVRGGVTIAKAARVSAAVIGLTIVSMGTSLPELTVSLAATFRGATEIAVGNVVGSNIFNVCGVLGFAAVVQPMRVHGSAVRLEWPFMFLASFQLLLLARDGVVDRLEGGFFLVGLLLFTAYAVRIGRTEVAGEEAKDLAREVAGMEAHGRLQSVGGALLLIGAGIGLLVAGGEVLVRGAVELARAAGLSERIIGLTIVAAGTSAPELATSVVAARKGQSEIALGNVIGSNIFNILGIIGITAIVRPLPVSAAMLGSDIWWMLATALVLYPMMRSRYLVGRGEGALLIGAYAAYTTLLLAGR